MMSKREYNMPPAPEIAPGVRDYWSAVTDVRCPACQGGIARWAEAGRVPGYRICDGCGTHFLAKGSATAPILIELEVESER